MSWVRLSHVRKKCPLNPTTVLLTGKVDGANEYNVLNPLRHSGNYMYHLILALQSSALCSQRVFLSHDSHNNGEYIYRVTFTWHYKFALLTAVISADTVTDTTRPDTTNFQSSWYRVVITDRIHLSPEFDRVWYPVSPCSSPFCSSASTALPPNPYPNPITSLRFYCASSPSSHSYLTFPTFLVLYLPPYSSFTLFLFSHIFSHFYSFLQPPPPVLPCVFTLLLCITFPFSSVSDRLP
jgi:hypothetical protein